MPRRLATILAIVVLGTVGTLVSSHWSDILDHILHKRVVVPEAKLPKGVLLRQEYKVKRWGEHSGKWHGTYKTYRQDSDVLFGTAEWVNGTRHGVFTRWNRFGEVVSQKRLEGTVTVEKRSEPPWWNEVQDQELPDDYEKRIYSCWFCAHEQHAKCAGVYKISGGGRPRRQGQCMCAVCE